MRNKIILWTSWRACRGWAGWLHWSSWLKLAISADSDLPSPCAAGQDWHQKYTAVMWWCSMDILPKKDRVICARLWCRLPRLLAASVLNGIEYMNTWLCAVGAGQPGWLWQDDCWLWFTTCGKGVNPIKRTTGNKNPVPREPDQVAGGMRPTWWWGPRVNRKVWCAWSTIDLPGWKNSGWARLDASVKYCPVNNLNKGVHLYKNTWQTLS